MATIDLADFSRPDFDVKGWVNIACASKSSDESLDKVLSELEMRLQLTAEEVDSSLHDASGMVMRRIPAMIQEIYRLQGDIYGMQDVVKGLVFQTERDEAQARAAVEVIGDIAQVKRNVEGACSTLKEATELSDMFYKVEDVFRSGDLITVADMLSTMRRSIELVGDVPEFKDSKTKLQTLEDRLQSLVEGSLADAFSSNKESTVQKLSSMLIAVERYNTVETLYCNSRLGKLNVVWEHNAGSVGDVGTQLPSFYTEVTGVLAKELKWCRTVFPDHAAGLLATLMHTFFQRVSRPIKDKLASETRLPTLVKLLGVVDEVVKTLTKDLLAQAPLDQQTRVVKLVVEPIEEKITQYSLLEASQLSGELSAALEPVVASVEDVDLLVKKVQESVKVVYASCRAAVDRCVTFTGGTELAGLMKALDSVLSHYLMELRDRVKVFQARTEAQLGIRNLGPGSAIPSPDLAVFQEVSTSMLAFVLLGREVSSGFGAVEATLRTSISNSVSSYESSTADEVSSPQARGPNTNTHTSSKGPTGVLGLRLICSPSVTDQLQVLASCREDSRFLPLPSSVQALDSLLSSFNSAVFESLLAYVRYQLREFPSMSEWNSSTAPGGTGGLPSFHLYPLQYITAIGEYLMTMPPKLEVLMGEGEEETEGDELAAEWLDKVVTGAGAIYTDAVCSLKEVSQAGAMQLAVDVEYFCNMMGAMQVQPPLPLITIQLCASQAPEQFVEQAAAAAADSSLDVRVLRLIAEWKKVTLDF